MKNIIKTFANINILIGAMLMVIPIGFLTIFNFVPKNQVLAAFEAEKEDKILATAIFAESETKFEQKYTFKDPFKSIVPEVKEQPLKFDITDAVTTTGATIQISGIKVNTTIYESTNLEAALVHGIWRDPKYGTPDNNEQPVILAAHRWGENSTSWDWRNQHLFTEFDQLKGGEVVTITWNGKVYKYKINKIETSTHVTQVSDLIMYTCIDYYSPERIIVYADLVR